MKKALQLALGIVTSVGGFFDIGNLATGMQAGAAFRFQLLWTLALGTLIVILLAEMSGRFAAVTQKALPEAIREHLGFRAWLLPFILLVIVHLLTIAAELGGVCFALQLITGIHFSAWAIPVAILLWLMLWRVTFDGIEYSAALLGLITLCFAVAAVVLHPPRSELLAGLLPSLPTRDPTKYWLIAVSIIGALIAPYLFYFYSSGAIEDEWDQTYIWVNRGVAALGMSFGAVISAGAMIVAALVLQPRGIAVDSISQAALALTQAFPYWGYLLFAASLGVACVGATIEVTLSLAYATAQTFGWRWGESGAPYRNARFATVYTGALILGALVIAAGLDPLKLTLLTMSLNAAVLPVVAIPFLILMNDKRSLRQYVNGPVTNLLVAVIVVISIALAVVSLPLLVLGG
jgi:NRAMP (natural resistance-associated macrophage protein)-like metal ion transporter